VGDLRRIYTEALYQYNGSLWFAATLLYTFSNSSVKTTSTVEK
jgi:hypothetical protein